MEVNGSRITVYGSWLQSEPALSNESERAGKRRLGLSDLERQAQSDGHDASSGGAKTTGRTTPGCAELRQALRLAESRARHVGVNTIERRMIEQILSLRTELQTPNFGKFEGFCQAHVHLNKARSHEDVSPERAESLKRSASAWIGRVVKQCTDSARWTLGRRRSGINACDTWGAATDASIVSKNAVGRAGPAVNATQA
jgi:hypothetical protein